MDLIAAAGNRLIMAEAIGELARPAAVIHHANQSGAS